MKKIFSFLLLVVLSSILISPVRADETVTTTIYPTPEELSTPNRFCIFTPNGAVSGDITLTNSCVIYESVNGVSGGNLTIDGANISLHRTLTYDPGKKIDVINGGLIWINTGGQILQSKLCVKDADSDHYADTTAVTTDPNTGLALSPTLSSPLNQIDYVAADQSTGLCPSQYNYREDMNPVNLVDADPNTTDSTRIATPDRELLRLGFTVAGIQDALAATGDVQIIDRNLIVCTTGSCNATFTSPTTGNIFASGSVGIGVTNPSKTLDVNGDINMTAGHGLYVGGSPYIGSQWTTTGNNIYYTTGNVGIGTTNPTATLSVNGNLYMADGSAGSPAVSFAADTNTGFYRQANDLLSFVANGQNSLNIDGTSGVGRLMIGNGNAASRLQINDDNNNAASGITLGGNSGTYIQIYKSASNQLAIMNGNVGIGLTNPSYKFQVTGSLYVSGSSRDYKQNITPLEIDPSKIYQLNPVSYDYKPQYKDLGLNLAGGRQIGLIAEDVAKVYPELAITLNRDGVQNKVSNVDYEKLSVLLLAEMKNQKKEIDSLKSQIDTLEQRLIQIENKLK